MFLALLPMLLSLAPHIVTSVEAMFGHGSGKDKKAAAVAMLGDAVNVFASSKGLPGANSEVMVLISDVIEAFVKYMNTSGQFSHGGAQ